MWKRKRLKNNRFHIPGLNTLRQETIGDGAAGSSMKVILLMMLVAQKKTSVKRTQERTEYKFRRE